MQDEHTENMIAFAEQGFSLGYDLEQVASAMAFSPDQLLNWMTNEWPTPEPDELTECFVGWMTRMWGMQVRLAYPVAMPDDRVYHDDERGWDLCD